MTSELCYLSIAETGPLLKSQQLSPVELTNAFLDRIETIDRCFFVPNVFGPQSCNSVQGRDAVLITIRSRKLYDGKFHRAAPIPWTS